MTNHAPALTRRSVLGAAVAVPAVGVLGPSPAIGHRGGHGGGMLPVRGGDLSFTLQLEQAGVRWSHRGRDAPVERIFAEAGATWTRLRVWVDPPPGYSTLESAIVLTRRANRAGMRVLLDLHYSDFWADPAHQTTPAVWADQDLDRLTDTVRRYTRDAIEALDRAGARVDMVQIGNEVTAGMLWPLGQIYATSTPEWEGFTALLRAGIRGAREARVHGPRPQVMLHIDRGGDNGGARWFFDHVLERDVSFDVIGLSYYPFWHGPLEDLEANLADLATRYRKDIIVVETAYPWTMENGDELENHIDTADELPDADKWPATPTGQLAFFKALRDVFPRVPHRRGLGFMLWEPEWIPGVGWTPGEGNPNDNLTLFDFEGRSLPALNALAPYRSPHH